MGNFTSHIKYTNLNLKFILNLNFQGNFCEKRIIYYVKKVQYLLRVVFAVTKLHVDIANIYNNFQTLFKWDSF